MLLFVTDTLEVNAEDKATLNIYNELRKCSSLSQSDDGKPDPNLESLGTRFVIQPVSLHWKDSHSCMARPIGWVNGK